MVSRLADVEQTLDLPPGYTLVALREIGDAFAHGCEIAAESGAGTLVWVRRYDLVEFAVVLEPDEPLASARRAFFAGMNALADAISPHCPPEREVSFDWPDADQVRRRIIGRRPARLAGRIAPRTRFRRGWCSASSCAPPTWPGLEEGRLPRTCRCSSEGFEMIDGRAIIESFARHLLTAFDPWTERGFKPVAGTIWRGFRGASRRAARHRRQRRSAGARRRPARGRRNGPAATRCRVRLV